MADIAATGGHAAAHGHEHGHPARLQHHFDTSAQQFEASKLGMWLFLGTEVLFFSGLFCAYTVYRFNHPEIFAYAHKSLSVFWGALNTIILIASSFTMALGVWCAQKSNRPGLVICLILTLAGAAGFMVIKAIEYNEKFQHGKLWGRLYQPVQHDDHAHDAGGAADAHAAASGGDAHGSDARPADAAHGAAAPAAGHGPSAAFQPERSSLAEPNRLPPGGVKLSKLTAAGDDKGHGGPKPADVHNEHIFYGIYFCLTGLHGLHVLAGMVVLSCVLVGAVQGRYHAGYYTPVDLGGLYWHLVDLIWIFLFPLLYLIH